jgi:hypothetical protein
MNRTHKNKIMRFIGASLASVAVGIVSSKIVSMMRTIGAKKEVEKKLDSALEDSMDCSDPVTKY